MIFNNVPNTESFSECIPTNGDMIKTLFPNIDASLVGEGDVIDVYNLGIYCQTFDTDWWNAPYKKAGDN